MYKFIEFIDHLHQCKTESIGWHEAIFHFQSEREHAAYEAGFQQGAMAAKNLLQLHAELKLSD